MKTNQLICAALVSTFLGAQGKTAEKPPSQNDLAERSGYRLSSAGVNQDKWTKLTATTNAATGTVTTRTNSFVAISAGKNRWDGERWVPAEPKLVVTNNSIVGM